MTESKSSELEDRLSELPDSLIHYILEFLPITDVVKTTILSTRWKNLWTTMPCLVKYSLDSAETARDFVNEVLKVWRGSRIIKFVVNMYTNESSFSDIDSWMRFAMENRVEELCLRMYSPLSEDNEYLVPQYLYSCSSLKQLSIKGCVFGGQGDVRWNRLKNLSIECFEISENDVDRILSGCPQLEVLMLCVLENDDNLSIRSSSLKMLSIEKCTLFEGIITMDSELRIWTPNLETLRMLGTPYSKCSLMNVASLTHASLGFYHSGICRYESCDSCPWDTFLGERLREIFPIIHHVEEVTLSDRCIKVLRAAIGKCFLSPVPSVKILHLSGYLEEYEQILGLLEMFPKLNMLVLDAEEGNGPIRANHAKISLNFERDLSKSIQLQLKIVEFSWMKGDAPSLQQWKFHLENLAAARLGVQPSRSRG